jgi:hypothetical protein
MREQCAREKPNKCGLHKICVRSKLELRETCVGKCGNMCWTHHEAHMTDGFYNFCVIHIIFTMLLISY